MDIGSLTYLQVFFAMIFSIMLIVVSHVRRVVFVVINKLRAATLIRMMRSMTLNLKSTVILRCMPFLNFLSN